MLLTISTTHFPATDLGYLLHKHPSKLQTFELTAGQAHVFYPEATEERCTIALLLEIDPIGLVRKDNAQSQQFALQAYVNDRPYAASSFTSVAISKAFSSALGGRCKDRPGLAEIALPLEATIAVVPCRGGEGFLRRLFEPLGYEVQTEAHELDPAFPEWGQSPYFTVTLRQQVRLQELLQHLYLLIPVLDYQTHYYIGTNEVEKLLEKGGSWLARHPEKELITRRYLRNIHSLANQALYLLTEGEENPVVAEAVAEETGVRNIEELKLHDQRLHRVYEVIKASGARKVLDLGCGEGKLLRLLLRDPQFDQIQGMDVSYRSLEIAKERLNLQELPQRQKDRIRLLQGALTYRDKRLEGFEAAALVEVIEHLDEERLLALERVVFEFARPVKVIITTPNAEYNQKFEKLAAGEFRHSDHRFEWTRPQFEAWANRVAVQHGYQTEFAPLGPEEEQFGAPSQMGIFTLAD
jgi:3' terminal RNA ribose 2'-O-methyltransferase Hen1